MILGFEEVENFKDAEVAFFDAMVGESDREYLVDDELDDRASEENMPRRSSRNDPDYFRHEMRAEI
jgi:hypothetical protein